MLVYFIDQFAKVRFWAKNVYQNVGDTTLSIRETEAFFELKPCQVKD